MPAAQVPSTSGELGIAKGQGGDFKCLVCTKSFMHYSTAKRHYREVHIDQVQDYECCYCGKHYCRQRLLNEHMMRSHQISQKMLQNRFVPE
jgi:uncharacterized Zn-finger protein